MHFIRTLELSNIPNEDWKAWSTYLGNTHSTMSYDSLQSACRTYYTTHMLPHLRPMPQEQAYATASSTPGRGRGSDRGSQRGRGNTQRGGRSTSNNPKGPGRLPTDPNAFGTHCDRSGHAATYCFRKYKESGSGSSFTEWCVFQDTCGAPSPPPYRAPQAPSGNRPSNPLNAQGRSYAVRTSCLKINSGYDEWLYDTACTETMTSHREFFSNYDEFDTPVEIHGINGNLQAYGYGDVIVKDVRNNQHTLLAIWYTPELDGSILSKYWTKQYGLRTTMDDHENFHFRSADPTSTFHFTATTIDKISVITDLDVIEYNPDSLTVIVPAAMAATAVIGTGTTAAVTKTPKINRSVPSQLMHLRLGHASEKPMRLLGISYKSGKCHPCIMGKQSQKPFPAVIEKSSIKLFRVYSDICPVTPESFGHGLYFIVFVDEATYYTWVYIIPNKSSSTVLEILKLWLPLVERQAGTSLINIRTDGGGEYKGETLHTVTPFLAERGINHEQTSLYSSSSNGVAERMNRTLMNMVRSMILTSGLPAPFWGEALHTAAKIVNRLPTSALLDNISPHQAWFGVIPKISHLRVFGCVCFVKITHPITKVQTRSDRCCFLGYEGTTQYRVYDPTSNKIRSKMRDVTFIEDEFLPRKAFLHVPYADRPLQVPEPRNYSEEDDELDKDELTELFPKINSSAPVPIIPLLP